MKSNRAPRSREAAGRPHSAGIAATGLKQPEIASYGTSEADVTVARLSERYRVVGEGGPDPRQWLLQRRSGAKGREAWTSISFCSTCDGLLLAIRDKCLPAEDFPARHDYPGLSPATIAIVKALPLRFPRKLKEAS